MDVPCHVLQNRARCSELGRILFHAMPVVHITMPDRVRAKSLGAKTVSNRVEACWDQTVSNRVEDPRNKLRIW